MYLNMWTKLGSLQSDVFRPVLRFMSIFVSNTIFDTVFMQIIHFFFFFTDKLNPFVHGIDSQIEISEEVNAAHT